MLPIEELVTVSTGMGASLDENDFWHIWSAQKLKKG
jgi:hypothetical protein